MSVLVDTSVWSLVLRRRQLPDDDAIAREFATLVRENRAHLIGPIRQEVLSGIQRDDQCQMLRSHLRAFEDLPIEVGDYEEAARFYNRCRAAGVQGSHTDFLICAVAHRYDTPIFTADRDFTRYANHIPVTLHTPRGA